MGHSKVEGKMHPVPWVDWDNIAPAGSINSSVHEMSKWIMLQLGRGTYQDKQFFSMNSSIEMWTVNNPFKVSEASMKLWPSKHFSGYGLGWSLYDYHGKLVVTHGGGLEGQISRVLLVPEEKIGMVILTNSINSLPAVPACGKSPHIVRSMQNLVEIVHSTPTFGYALKGDICLTPKLSLYFQKKHHAACPPAGGKHGAVFTNNCY
ncbi:MAG: serine hydrolase [Bacteroidota bacterium]|nr:serine hydrolase [Bacteroidota bacterium]